MNTIHKILTTGPLVKSVFVICALLILNRVQSQPQVIVSGVRFATPLMNQFVLDFNAENAEHGVSLVRRGLTDPPEAEIIIDAHPDYNGIKASGKKVYDLGSYIIVPFANVKSSFYKLYADKGLTGKEIKYFFFEDPYRDEDELPFKLTKVDASKFSFYTRMQKAGVPEAFALCHGYTQQQIKGNPVAGSDEHTRLAVTKDDEGICYGTLPLLFDLKTRKPVEGIAVFNLDIDGNGKISEEEKVAPNLDAWLTAIQKAKKTDGLCRAPLYFYFRDQNPSPAALEFADWLQKNAGKYLNEYGFLKAPGQ